YRLPALRPRAAGCRRLAAGARRWGHAAFATHLNHEGHGGHVAAGDRLRGRPAAGARRRGYAAFVTHLNHEDTKDIQVASGSRQAIGPTRRAHGGRPGLSRMKGPAAVGLSFSTVQTCPAATMWPPARRAGARRVPVMAPACPACSTR